MITREIAHVGSVEGVNIVHGGALRSRCGRPRALAIADGMALW
jgi:hypothetical protein